MLCLQSTTVPTDFCTQQLTCGHYVEGMEVSLSAGNPSALLLTVDRLDFGQAFSQRYPYRVYALAPPDRTTVAPSTNTGTGGVKGNRDGGIDVDERLPASGGLRMFRVDHRRGVEPRDAGDSGARAGHAPCGGDKWGAGDAASYVAGVSDKRP